MERFANSQVEEVTLCTMHRPWHYDVGHLIGRARKHDVTLQGKQALFGCAVPCRLDAVHQVSENI